jgi:hypothetical protein
MLIAVPSSSVLEIIRRLGRSFAQVLYRITYSQFEMVVERCVRDHWYMLRQIEILPRPKSAAAPTTAAAHGGDAEGLSNADAELTDLQRRERETERRERAIRGANLTLWQGERTIAQVALEEIKFKRRLEETNQRERARLAELDRQRLEKELQMQGESTSEAMREGLTDGNRLLQVTKEELQKFHDEEATAEQLNEKTERELQETKSDPMVEFEAKRRALFAEWSSVVWREICSQVQWPRLTLLCFGRCLSAQPRLMDFAHRWPPKCRRLCCPCTAGSCF